MKVQAKQNKSKLVKTNDMMKLIMNQTNNYIIHKTNRYDKQVKATSKQNGKSKGHQKQPPVFTKPSHNLRNNYYRPTKNL